MRMHHLLARAIVEELHPFSKLGALAVGRSQCCSPDRRQCSVSCLRPSTFFTISRTLCSKHSSLPSFTSLFCKCDRCSLSRQHQVSLHSRQSHSRSVSSVLCGQGHSRAVLPSSRDQGHSRQALRTQIYKNHFCGLWGVTCQQNVTMATSRNEEENAGHRRLLPEEEMIRQQLREVFLTAVESVMPRSMLDKVIHFDPKRSLLTVKDRTYTVQRNVFVVGFGKGVLGMARVVDELLREHIIKGLLSIPSGARAQFELAGKGDLLLEEGSKICVQEGAANNLPDDKAFRAARDIHKLVSNLTSKDIVIVLMSGGGSALLPYPIEPLDMEDVLQTTRQLFSHGATIGDVNTVRKHLELLKGGGLAKAAIPAQVISLIISDVIGDSLDLIASGPTVRQTYSPQRCLEVIDRLNARQAMPQKVMTLLETRKSQLALQSQLTFDPRGGVTEAAVDDKTEWGRVHNVLVGSNAICCAAAAECAEQLGFAPFVLSHELCGEARQVGTLLAKLGQYIWACCNLRTSSINKDLVLLEMDITGQGISKNKLNQITSLATSAHNSKKDVCVVAGGETTVTIQGSGRGGRNQEMVLAAGLQLHQGFSTLEDRQAAAAAIYFLSAGTDGQDGPTDAAGAVVDEKFVLEAQEQDLDPHSFLQYNDSYTLWSRYAAARDLIVTGLTGTNVMDIQLLVIRC